MRSRKSVEPLFKATEVSIILEEIALQPGISDGMDSSFVHDILLFHKVGAQTSDRRA
jgi:hypothetical protein